MKVKRGDIILIDHLFSDASGSKVRPVLVVQSDARNAMLTSTVVVMITKNVRRGSIDLTQVLIDVGTPEGKQTGLNVDSAITCGNLFTVHESLIRKKIGTLSSLLMDHVNDGLKTALAIP